MTYYYSAYGLILQSQLLLPCLPASVNDIALPNQVRIIYGSVAQEGLDNPIIKTVTSQATKTQFWLNIPAIARFLVSDGQHIIIDPMAGIDEDSIRVFLLSTCLEILLKQRNILILPGFALERKGLGVCFAGSHAMLQGLFYQRGYTFLSSDVIALNSQVLLLPGIAQLEFWPNVLTALNLQRQALKPVRPGIEKYIIPLEEHYYPKSLPLKIIYILKRHQHSSIHFSSVDQKDYWQQLIATPHLSAPLWHEQQTEINYFDEVEMICIQLPQSGLKLQELVTAIEHDLTQRGHCYAGT